MKKFKARPERGVGVPYRNPYACRHTYAIRMLQAGNGPLHVAEQIGHTSPQMIYRHYARWALAPKIAKES